MARECSAALADPLVRGGDGKVVLKGTGEFGLVAVAGDAAGQKARATERFGQSGLRDPLPCGAAAKAGDPRVIGGVGCWHEVGRQTAGPSFAGARHGRATASRKCEGAEAQSKVSP